MKEKTVIIIIIIYKPGYDFRVGYPYSTFPISYYCPCEYPIGVRDVLFCSFTFDGGVCVVCRCNIHIVIILSALTKRHKKRMVPAPIDRGRAFAIRVPNMGGTEGEWERYQSTCTTHPFILPSGIIHPRIPYRGVCCIERANGKPLRHDVEPIVTQRSHQQ